MRGYRKGEGRERGALWPPGLSHKSSRNKTRNWAEKSEAGELWSKRRSEMVECNGGARWWNAMVE